MSEKGENSRQTPMELDSQSDKIVSEDDSDVISDSGDDEWVPPRSTDSDSDEVSDSDSVSSDISDNENVRENSGVDDDCDSDNNYCSNGGGGGGGGGDDETENANDDEDVPLATIRRKKSAGQRWNHRMV